MTQGVNGNLDGGDGGGGGFLGLVLAFLALLGLGIAVCTWQRHRDADSYPMLAQFGKSEQHRGGSADSGAAGSAAHRRDTLRRQTLERAPSLRPDGGKRATDAATPNPHKRESGLDRRDSYLHRGDSHLFNRDSTLVHKRDSTLVHKRDSTLLHKRGSQDQLATQLSGVRREERQRSIVQEFNMGVNASTGVSGPEGGREGKRRSLVPANIRRASSALGVLNPTMPNTAKPAQRGSIAEAADGSGGSHGECTHGGAMGGGQGLFGVSIPEGNSLKEISDGGGGSGGSRADPFARALQREESSRAIAPPGKRPSAPIPSASLPSIPSDGAARPQARQARQARHSVDPYAARRAEARGVAPATTNDGRVAGHGAAERLTARSRSLQQQAMQLGGAQDAPPDPFARGIHAAQKQRQQHGRTGPESTAI